MEKNKRGFGCAVCAFLGERTYESDTVGTWHKCRRGGIVCLEKAYPCAQWRKAETQGELVLMGGGGSLAARNRRIYGGKN